MKLNVIILLFFCVFRFLNLNAQTYNYSYTDPCTGNLKTIVVPINGNVTVSYYGEIGSFGYNDFTNGTFDTWTNNIFAQYGTNSPCSEIVGLGTAVNVTQSSALNVIGILNSLSSIADLAGGATNILGGSVSSIGNSSGDSDNGGNGSQNGKKNNNKNQNNGTGNTNEGSSTTSGTNEGSSNGGNETSNQNAGTENPTQAGGTTTESGSNETGNTTTNETVGGEGSPEINNQTTTENGSNGNNGGSGTNGGNGNNGSSGNGAGNNGTQEGQGSSEGQGKTNITGGASATVKSTPTSKEGGKPTVVASADFVGFNFKNSDVKVGAKATGGYTSLRWDGKRSYGALVDYTSALKGPNITTFYAWVRPKSIILASGTLTIGFEGNKSLYGTFATGQMFNIKKAKGLKLLYMGTVSYGSVYRESFLGTAVIGGLMYDWKVGKRIDIKLMDLMVYAPYVSYYNDVVMKSPYVMLPSVGTNVRITKKFKFNINAGGAWDLKTSALNYTITCGTRMIVGQ